MPTLDVGEHLLRFRGVLDRLSRNRIEPVYLDYLPALGFCIEAGASLVRLRTFAPHLVFGRYTNPDADPLGFFRDALLCTHHTLLYLYVWEI